MSESTAHVDRGHKLREYRSLPTLQEYVLVDSRKRWVERHHRSAGSTWMSALPVTSGSIDLTSVGMSLDIDELYATVGVSAAST